jgi:hypothetical protein
MICVFKPSQLVQNPLSKKSQHIETNYVKAHCKVFEMAILEDNQSRRSHGVLESNVLPGSYMPDVICCSLKSGLINHFC